MPRHARTCPAKKVTDLDDSQRGGLQDYRSAHEATLGAKPDLEKGEGRVWGAFTQGGATLRGISDLKFQISKRNDQGEWLPPLLTS
jgi:hypothetical protein